MLHDFRSTFLEQFGQGADGDGLIWHNDGLDGLFLLRLAVVAVALPLERSSSPSELDGPVVATSSLEARRSVEACGFQ